MPTEIELLEEISHKLSQLLVLTKLSSSKAIAETKEQIRNDPVYRAILDLADGSISASPIKEKVMEQAKTSKATVERRISELIEKGALIAIRKGNEIFYENSGLYD